MKRKIVALLLAMCISVSITGCGEQVASKESGGVSAENNGGEANGGDAAAGEVAASEASPHEGDYAHVATRMLGGEMQYDQYELDFKGHDGEFTIKGYYCQEDFINGIAPVVTLENNEYMYTVIDTTGKELVDRTKYEYFTRVGESVVHDYFVVKDKKSQCFGVINRSGEEVVPCQYDEVKVLERIVGTEESVCIYQCIKGGTYDYYLESGTKIMEGMDGEVFYWEVEDSEPGKRLITLKIGEETYFTTENNGGLLLNPDEYVWGPGYRGEHVFIFEKTEGNREHIVFNEDWSSSEAITLDAGAEIYPLGENLLVYGYGDLAVCDKEWNVLKTFGGAVSLAQDTEGNYTFVSTSRSKEGDVIIFDENFEKLTTVTNREELKVAGGLVYGYPLNEEGDSPKIYDIYGKELYENVSDIREGDDCILFTLADGTVAFKTEEMAEVGLAGAGETLVETGSGNRWFCFTTADGKYVYRDSNMELMATFDAKAMYKEELGYFYLDGKYYDENGELAFEEEW